MSRIIGVNSLHVAKMKTDGAEGATWDTPVKVPSVINVDITDNKENVTFYSDDVIEQVLPAFSGKEVTIELGYLSNELEALVSGNSYKNGVFIQSTDAIADNFALLFKAPKSKGGERYMCLYKGVLSKDEDNYQGKGENVESSNVTLTGVFMPLEYNNCPMVKIDTDDEKLDSAGKTLVQKWFTEVPLAELPTVEPQSAKVKVSETKSVK